MTTPRVAKAKPATERIRQPTEIRRRLIVAAARTVIAEHGLFATTMRDIAAASAVSLGTLTYHFTGIEEILTEVLQGEMDLFYAPIAQRALAAPSADAAMSELIEGFFAEDTRTVQHWQLWLDFWATSVHNPRHAAWQAQVYAIWGSDVRAVLVRGQQSKEFKFDDLDTVMTEFMAVFDGLASQAYLPGSTLGPLQARAHLRGYLDRHIRRPVRSLKKEPSQKEPLQKERETS